MSLGFSSKRFRKGFDSLEVFLELRLSSREFRERIRMDLGKVSLPFHYSCELNPSSHSTLSKGLVDTCTTFLKGTDSIVGCLNLAITHA